MKPTALRENYAYTRIAGLYKSMNPAGRTLGLTASPGSSAEKITQLCHNLNIPPTNIEYRNKNSEDVKEYVYQTEVIKIPVGMTAEMEFVHKKLMELFQHLGYQLIQLCTECGINPPNNIDHITQRFCVDLQQRLIGELKKGDNSQIDTRSSRILVSSNAQVLKLIGMIKNLEAEGMTVALENIHGIFEKVAKQKGSKADFFLAQDDAFRQIYGYLLKLSMIIPNGILHPKLCKLKEITEHQITEQSASRILIFTKYRESVSMIVKFLGDSALIKPRKFVGQAGEVRNRLRG